MNPREAHFEENLRRWLKASWGPEVDVPPAARHQLRQRLLAEWGARPAPAEFPDAVLGVLTCGWLLLAAACVAAGLGHRSLLAHSVALSPLGALVLVNLLGLPVASLVIILRRRSCRNV